MPRSIVGRRPATTTGLGAVRLTVHGGVTSKLGSVAGSASLTRAVLATADSTRARTAGGNVGATAVTASG